MRFYSELLANFHNDTGRLFHRTEISLKVLSHLCESRVKTYKTFRLYRMYQWQDDRRRRVRLAIDVYLYDGASPFVLLPVPIPSISRILSAFSTKSGMCTGGVVLLNNIVHVRYASEANSRSCFSERAQCESFLSINILLWS